MKTFWVDCQLDPTYYDHFSYTLFDISFLLANRGRLTLARNSAPALELDASHASVVYTPYVIVAAVLVILSTTYVLINGE